MKNFAAAVVRPTITNIYRYRYAYGDNDYQIPYCGITYQDYR